MGGLTSESPATSCGEIESSDEGRTYFLTDGTTTYETLCDFGYDGGGWTLIAAVRDNDESLGSSAHVWSLSLSSGIHPWDSYDLFGSPNIGDVEDFKSRAYSSVPMNQFMVKGADGSTIFRTASSETGVLTHASFRDLMSTLTWAASVDGQATCSSGGLSGMEHQILVEDVSSSDVFW